MSHLIRKYRAGKQVILTDEVRTNGISSSSGAGQNDASLPATMEEARRLHREAAALLESAQTEAADLLTAAQIRIETLEAEAQARGYEAGYEQGVQEGQARGVEAMAHSVASARTLLKSFTEERARLLRVSESEVVALVMAIVERVVGTIGRSHRESVLHNVRSALDQLGRIETFEIRVHPQDAAYLTDLWSDEESGDPQWRIHPDTAIAPGGCILSAGPAVIDARLSTQMRVLVDGLSIDNFEPADEASLLRSDETPRTP